MPAAGSSPEAPILTDRLHLPLLRRAWLESFASKAALPGLGFSDPDGFLAGSETLVDWRLQQIASDPSQEPWLIRAIVLRETGTAGGDANLHAPPDAR